MGTRRFDVRISRWLSTGSGGSLSLAMAHGRQGRVLGRVQGLDAGGLVVPFLQ